MMPRIILWIVIVFFIVYSSCSPPVLKGTGESICYKNVSRKIISNGFDYKDQIRATDHFLRHLKTGILPQTLYETVWLVEKICCPGYYNKSGICTPLQCSTKCENGYCAKPNICECNNNWGGDFCDKPLFCTVIKPVCINVSGIVSENPVQEHFENVGGNPLIEWKGLPECRPRCLEQVLSEKCTRSAKMTYISLPIDTPCNAIAAHWIFFSKYSYVLGVIGIIVLFVIVILIVCIVRKKRRSIIIMNFEPSDAGSAGLEAEYEYVDLKQVSDEKPGSEAEYEYVDLNQVSDEKPRYAQCKYKASSIHYPQAE